MNFWLFLLSGLQNITKFLLDWIFGGPGAYHQAMGFTQAIGNGLMVFIDIFFSTFGIFNWTLPVICIGLYMTVWTVTQGIRIWRLIKIVFLFMG